MYQLLTREIYSNDKIFYKLRVIFYTLVHVISSINLQQIFDILIKDLKTLVSQSNTINKNINKFFSDKSVAEKQLVQEKSLFYKYIFQH